MTSACPFAAALVVLALAWPAAAQDSAYPLSVTDAKGRELTFEAAPTRVIAVYDQAYGQLAALGVRPVGATIPAEMAADAAYFLPDGASIPEVGTLDGAIDAEAVAALAPDLILGYRDEVEEALSALAPFYAMPTSPSLAYYRDNLRELGLILDRRAEAEAAIAAMDARIAAYAARVEEPLDVMAVGYGGDSFTMFTRTFISCEILAEVGTCDWPDPDPDTHWISGGSEALLALDPEAIVLANWSGLPHDQHLAQLAADPLWGELRAVREGRVVALEEYADPYAGSVAGVAKFLDYVVLALYPAAFPDGPLTDSDVAAALQE